MNIENWDGKVLRGTRKRNAETEKLVIHVDWALGRVISSFKLTAGRRRILKNCPALRARSSRRST